jgi:hypothetical protein
MSEEGKYLYDFEFDWICKPALGLGDFQTAFVKENSIYLLPPDIKMESMNPLEVDCKASSAHCFISERILGRILTYPQPCLTLIHRDGPLTEIHAKCRANCEQDTGEARKPKVLEARGTNDTVYVSRALTPFRRVCKNSSLDALIDPPGIGALEMKVPCGCTLVYKNKEIWNRRKAESCSPNPNPDNAAIEKSFEAIQVLASNFMGYDLEGDMRRSDIDSRIFLNVSGRIVEKEVLDEMQTEQLLDLVIEKLWITFFLVLILLAECCLFC